MSKERGPRPDGLLEIRPSLLGDYSDCGLRAAAKAYPELFRSKGFEPRAMVRSVAAAVGTGVHFFVSHSLTAYLKAGGDTNIKDSVDAAVAEYETECKDLDPKLSVDDQTPRLADGKVQVSKLSHLYQQTVGYKVRVEMVEERLEARLGDKAMLSGEPDHLTKSEILVDIKTGSRHKLHEKQTAGYAALLAAHNKPVRKIREVFLRRLKIDKPLEQPTISDYDPNPKVALAAAQRIINDVESFKLTGDPVMSFPQNPMSIMCSEKWCCAYKTTICPLWKAKERE
jgi:hypothetical protein